MIRSSGPPDKTTPGNVGDIYQNTDNGEIFVCKDVNHHPVRHQFIEVSAKDVNTEYVWEDTRTPLHPYGEDTVGLCANNRKAADILPMIDFRNCTNFSEMFKGSTALTEAPELDTRNAENTSYMFDGCTTLTSTPNYYLPKLKDASYMFKDCSKITSYGDIRMPLAETLIGMFYNCGGLETVGDINLPYATDVSNMFYTCYKLKSIKSINIPNVINAEKFLYMLRESSGNIPVILGELESLPHISIPKCKNAYLFCCGLKNVTSISVYAPSVENCRSMFYGNVSVETISEIKSPNITNTMSMFNRCLKLKNVKISDTSKTTMVTGMFHECESLESVETVDMNSVTDKASCEYMFYNNYALTHLTLKNIRVSLVIGSGSSWGHLLTVDSLVNTIKELITSNTYQTLTMGTANLEKIKNLYCKIIDDTDPKKTMELCESTEEGAVTLVQYAQLKKWNIR